ncbi:NTP/NDP exchange transporter [Nannocystis pusilla]|uniref:MFS transporter n=1 Tax=Nannocystis pusilla TaxID=889268 RepID=A0ABS7U4W2_9BACT|nr:MFS transporter [Nannocystis pusilla]MBZ5715345.1 MFS transporter [Nannocystis pusilla]
MAEVEGRVWKMARAIAPLRREELPGALWSAGLIFCALCSFYILRPIRDEMGVAGGTDKLAWLFTATFLVMLAAVPLYSWVVARFGRRTIVPLVYRFCALVLLGFVAAFALLDGSAQVWTARAFFVWAAVYNLLVVSVFWELMADLWRREQGERLFGLVAAGGSAGALLGPLLTAALVPKLGASALVLLAALFLEGAIVCARGLMRSFRTGSQEHVHEAMSMDARPIGGGALAAFALIARSPRLRGISLWVVLLTTTATFAYFEQARIVKAAITDPGERTALFARADFVVNAISVALQGLAVGRIIPRLGVGWTLALLPIVSLVGFAVLAASPVVAVLIGFQIVRRAADFSLAKPAREVLFTQAGREAKYKAKHLIDTALYRGGDVAAGWLYSGLGALGVAGPGLCGVAALLCLPWAVLSRMLGRAGANEQGEEDRAKEAGHSPANT